MSPTGTNAHDTTLSLAAGAQLSMGQCQNLPGMASRYLTGKHSCVRVME